MFRLLLAAPLCAPWVLAQEQQASGPYECPKGQTAVRDRIKDQWVCKPRLQTKRDVFGPQKHPQDPCPDGYWWHKTRDFCFPVVCTQEQNPSQLKGLCPIGHHEHLNSGADWTRPIQCVEDYRKRNEATGGAPRRKGNCSLCVIDKPGHHGEQERPWFFEKPRAPGKEEPRRSPTTRLGTRGQGPPREAKPCSKGQYASDTGECRPCPAGAASAKRDDGRMFCVGGTAENSCPVGSGRVTADASQPSLCLPCQSGEESLVINGRQRCARNSCPEDSIPIPEAGSEEAYICLQPLESEASLNWARVLEAGRMNPTDAPECQEGQGLVLASGSYQCRRCTKGQRVVRRNGYPTCGR
ncbi:MAG: hypothetical protein WC728_12620 [Elusimicrobiota bacterium]